MTVKDVAVSTIVAGFVLTASVGMAADAKLDAAKAKYQQFCVSCHGPEGKGDGPGAAALKPKPQNLTDKKHMKDYSDEQLFKIIKMGGPAAGKSPNMPPWGGALKDDDIKDLVAFIRTLAK